MKHLGLPNTPESMNLVRDGVVSTGLRISDTRKHPVGSWIGCMPTRHAKVW